jgi:methionyl-tRNA formyltransferase
MRLVFLGSPASVLAPLKQIISLGPKSGHEVVGVVSQPARPVGRHGTPTDPAVAAYAKSVGIPVLQPEKASDPEFLAAFAAWAPDVAITAAYGQILTDKFLAIPKRATINIHPSLLPLYRGATPVPAALLDGATTSGVTVLFTVKKLDAGNIIAQATSPVGPTEKAGEMTDRLFQGGGELCLEALGRLKDPAFTGTPQDEARVTHCRKIDKHDGLVDWESPAIEISNRHRAHDPWPGSFTFQGDKRIALIDLKPGDTYSAQKPGDVAFDKHLQCLVVGTGDGVLHVTKLKPAGGKEMLASGFWNGLKDRSRVTFGPPPAGVGA